MAWGVAGGALDPPLGVGNLARGDEAMLGTAALELGTEEGCPWRGHPCPASIAETLRSGADEAVFNGDGTEAAAGIG